MTIRYADSFGITHTPCPQSNGLVFAWCCALFKSVLLNAVFDDDDAPPVTCLWCVLDEDQTR